ncbi:tRNA epoxyqueuosine(34) reductase QueG [Persicobacter psychrovividus]|uniref:Epoxyqueuosine reductase n=1 Tax=Persicobacter psychrovividus TaxID=387638 RepID=A0ABM7VBX1_9BACT|nr:epoxyqueuosine reductase [Persicobacter psychrovividus]
MNATAIRNNTQFLKAEAKRLGFDFVGVSKAEYLEEDAPLLEQWLKNDYQGKMQYLENHFDKRLDPRKLVEGAKSVVSLVYNYYPEEDLAKDGEYKFAKYAYGKDYHFVVKDRLKELMQSLNDEIGEIDGRIFVDSAPVMERSWAKKSGLGWIGKHSLLINKQQGSFFFLAELIIDLELEPDLPYAKDFCGTCTKCIDACPTEAIVAPQVVDGSKCISYLTIELKDQLPNSFKGQMDQWVFGCDVCQDVCPWNRFSKPHREPEFAPHPALGKMQNREWEELTQEVFSEIFRKSAVKRTKLAGLKRNIIFAKE